MIQRVPNSRNGYQSSNNVAIEGFIHHPVNGQVARLTHYF